VTPSGATSNTRVHEDEPRGGPESPDEDPADGDRTDRGRVPRRVGAGDATLLNGRTGVCHMEWKLFADLSEIAGDRTVEVDVESGETVGDALDALLTAHPELEERIMQDGELADHINVLRNGSNVRTGGGLTTELEAGDELALFPPVSGGRR